jgi:hypothetical protein
MRIDCNALLRCVFPCCYKTATTVAVEELATETEPPIPPPVTPPPPVVRAVITPAAFARDCEAYLAADPVTHTPADVLEGLCGVSPKTNISDRKVREIITNPMLGEKYLAVGHFVGHFRMYLNIISGESDEYEAFDTTISTCVGSGDVETLIEATRASLLEFEPELPIIIQTRAAFLELFSLKPETPIVKRKLLACYVRLANLAQRIEELAGAVLAREDAAAVAAAALE